MLEKQLYRAEITLPIVKEYASFMASDDHIPSPLFAASVQWLWHHRSKIIACRTCNWCDMLRNFRRGRRIRKYGPQCSWCTGVVRIWTVARNSSGVYRLSRSMKLLWCVNVGDHVPIFGVDSMNGELDGYLNSLWGWSTIWYNAIVFLRCLGHQQQI